jgi:hypothetical protein
MRQEVSQRLSCTILATEVSRQPAVWQPHVNSILRLCSIAKVLVTGGLDASGNALATAELFDPAAEPSRLPAIWQPLAFSIR